MAIYPYALQKLNIRFLTIRQSWGNLEGFKITVRDLKLSSGAGFVVALTGNILTMPGLPKCPAALNIDCDNSGSITGLF